MIPPEIINEILYRLPAKSVGRFRSVSKEWLSLLTKPAFIKTHQNTLNRNHLIFTRGRSLYSHPSHHHEPVLTPTKLPIELDRDITFHGSCDGLVLVSGYNKGRLDTFVLLNPTTRESVQLPQSGYESFFTTHGIGYDSVTDDYKVITLAYIDNHGSSTIRVSLYSLRDNTWRRLIDCPYRCWYFQYAVYLNGFFNWLSPVGIVTFSLADECFSEIPVPNLSNDTNITNCSGTRITVLGGKLAIYLDCDVWLMNEYGVKESWTKFPLDRFKEIPMGNTIIFYDNGKIRVANPGMMLIYDFEKITFSKNVYVWDSGRFLLEGTFVESLVSPKINVYN